jgi:hypothetical protein
MGQRSKTKALRRKARAELDKHMTGLPVEIDGETYDYDPKALNHKAREMMRKRFMATQTEGER